MKKLKMFLLTIVLILVLVVIYNLNFNKIQSDKAAKIETNYVLETPNITDKNLAQFYLWTKEDPLFTSPNFNSDAFLLTVNVLKDQQEKYLKENNLNDEIFPISFLKEVVSVNKLSNIFLKNPTRNNADQLISEYKKVIKFYDENRKILLSKISSFNPISPKDKFTNFATRTNFEIVKNNVIKLGDNSLELQKEIAKREECLDSGINCYRPVNSFINLKIVNEATPNDIKLLPREMIYEEDIKESVWTGPYSIKTPCFGWNENLTETSHLFYFIRGKEIKDYSKDQNKLFLAGARLATNIYYYKISNKSVDLPLFAHLNIENVMSFILTNIYDCPDFTYVSRLSSVDSLYMHNKNERIFSKLLKLGNLPNGVRDFLKQGNALEDKFFNAKYPSELQAETLANYYATFYYNSIKWSNDTRFSNKDWIEEVFKNKDLALNRYLEYSRYLSNIEEIIAQTVGNFSAFRVKVLMYPRIKDDYYFYAYRNMYNLLYLPFSSSFYRLSTPMIYLEKIKINLKYDYNRVFTYKEAVSKYSYEQIKSWDIDRSSILQKIFNEFLKNR